MPRPNRFAVELLEDRTVPATFGLAWPDADHLTLSFAPDGTDIGGTKNQLFSLLGSSSTSAWQRTILNAFQTWAIHGNINLSVIGDNGKPFGTPGPLQGASRFGDVRIAARPLADGVLAISTPFDLVNSWSGDVLINSSRSFTPGTAASYDLFSVMLQEAGHVFGIDNSTDPNSPMFENYAGVRTGLTAGDIKELHTLYGVRNPDRFEGTAGNETRATATPLQFVRDADQFSGDGLSGAVPWVAAGDVTTAGDVDFFKVVMPSSSSDFTVALRTSGISLLTARLSVYDQNGQLLRTTSATDPLNGDLTLSLRGSAGATYYVKVQGAAANVFGIGSYRLAVGWEASEAVSRDASLADDQGSNETRTTATVLAATTSEIGSRLDASTRGVIGSGFDVDYYKVVAPAVAESQEAVLIATVWASDDGQFPPRVTVRDAQGQILSGKILVDDGLTYSVQITDITGGASYFIKVQTADPWRYREGDYGLAVDFRTDPVRERLFAYGALDQNWRQDKSDLTINTSQLFRIKLSVDAGGVATAAAVQMAILDADGHSIFSMTSRAGYRSAADVLLAPGTYTVTFTAITRTGESLPLLRYEATGLSRSDPIGLEPVDTTFTPVGNPVMTPPVVDPYAWTRLWMDYWTFLGLADPTSNGLWR